MGLFDKVLGTKEQNLNEADAFAGVALCAVAADGMITDEEALGLGTTLSRMKLFQGKSPREMNATFERVLKIARAQGIDALLNQSAAAVSADLRPTAFAIATDLIMADGHVDPKEKQFLEKIQRALGVDDATAMKVVEVIAIKNHG